MIPFSLFFSHLPLWTSCARAPRHASGRRAAHSARRAGVRQRRGPSCLASPALAQLCAGRVRADSYPHAGGGTAVTASSHAAQPVLGARARQRAPAASAAARPGTAAPTGRARGWHRAQWRKSLPAAGQRFPRARPRLLLAARGPCWAAVTVMIGQISRSWNPGLRSLPPVARL